MSIKVKCVGCGKTLSVVESMAGKKGKCPYCLTVLDIPESTPAKSTFEIPSGPPILEKQVCPGCGKVLMKDDVFCVNCGTDIQTGDKFNIEDVSEESTPTGLRHRRPISRPKKTAPARVNRQSMQGYKKCPACAQTIKADARICPYCRSNANSMSVGISLRIIVFSILATIFVTLLMLTGGFPSGCNSDDSLTEDDSWSVRQKRENDIRAQDRSCRDDDVWAQGRGYRDYEEYKRRMRNAHNGWRDNPYQKGLDEEDVKELQRTTREMINKFKNPK